MYILVTGTAGLLGSKFTEWLLENLNDVTVVGIDDLSGGYLENVPNKTKFFNISLNNYEKVEEIFQSYKFNYIFHFAAYAAEGLSPFIRKFNYNNNLLNTTNLINMSIKYKIKRFIFTSSMAVYGEGKTPFDEDNNPSPIDPYGIAKYACEMDLKIAKEQHNLDYCIIRPHNVYGENQNISGEIINLGGIREIEIKEAAEIFREIVNDKEYPIDFLQERHEVKNAWSTHQKSIDLLDFEHKTSLKEGLKKMIEWAKKQPQREIKKWENYELDVDIYEYWK